MDVRVRRDRRLRLREWMLLGLGVIAAAMFWLAPHTPARANCPANDPNCMSPPPPPPGGGGGNGGGGNSCSCVNGVCTGNACPKPSPPPPPPPPPAGAFAPPPPPSYTRTPVVPPPPPAGSFAPNLPATPTQTPTADVAADPPRADVAPTPVPDGKLIADNSPSGKKANTGGEAAGAAAAGAGGLAFLTTLAKEDDDPEERTACLGCIGMMRRGRLT